jgi:hypothetical protein
VLKHFTGSSFETVEDACALSSAVEVFSHTLYLQSDTPSKSSGTASPATRTYFHDSDRLFTLFSFRTACKLLKKSYFPPQSDVLG